MQIEIRLISFGSPEYENEVALRTKVLREPLGLRFTPEDLQRESNDIHVGAFAASALVGCLLLSPQDKRVMKMRQVAVLPEARGLGIAKRLVAFAEALAKQRGFDSVILNARQSAVTFYEALGYEAHDETFEEVTIPHRKMRKSLI